MYGTPRLAPAVTALPYHHPVTVRLCGSLRRWVSTPSTACAWWKAKAVDTTTTRPHAPQRLAVRHSCWLPHRVVGGARNGDSNSLLSTNNVSTSRTSLCSEAVSLANAPCRLAMHTPPAFRLSRPPTHMQAIVLTSLLPRLSHICTPSHPRSVTPTPTWLSTTWATSPAAAMNTRNQALLPTLAHRFRPLPASAAPCPPPGFRHLAVRHLDDLAHRFLPYPAPSPRFPTWLSDPRSVTTPLPPTWLSGPCSACDRRSAATCAWEAPSSATTSTSEGPAGMSMDTMASEFCGWDSYGGWGHGTRQGRAGRRGGWQAGNHAVGPAGAIRGLPVHHPPYSSRDL